MTPHLFDPAMGLITGTVSTEEKTRLGAQASASDGD
ncbi:hypothetical protein GA0115254_1216154 [Streptomyces sp. Ncost-T10-10d]|nr:hypothetical protein GA0115254_1216154 [Streptomyces sp. Ncost-T10-10d]